MNTRLSGISDPNVLIGDGQQRNGDRVLYIEDNQSNLTLVEWILERDAGIALIAAMGGRRGIELAQQQQPDLIVLDLHLPDMPGETVLQCLQAEVATRRIPVVVLSADASEKRIKRLLELGARSYLTKPFDIAHFLEVIASHLKKPA